MLSIPHMIVVFVIVLVVFGPQKLPELARGLGKLMAEFRKASTDFKSAFEEEMRDLDRQAREVERKKQALLATAAAEQVQPATLATPSGVETQAPSPELASTSQLVPSESESRATEAGILVVTPVPESVPRGIEKSESPQLPQSVDSPEPASEVALKIAPAPATPGAPPESQLDSSHDHQQPA
jgi:sec-independent protein translocase protein TatB